jgi:hypothetical protein
MIYKSEVWPGWYTYYHTKTTPATSWREGYRIYK